MAIYAAVFSPTGTSRQGAWSIATALGDAVLLVPKESLWNTFVDGVNSFTEDIFENGRDQGAQEDRESL